MTDQQKCPNDAALPEVTTPAQDAATAVVPPPASVAVHAAARQTPEPSAAPATPQAQRTATAPAVPRPTSATAHAAASETPEPGTVPQAKAESPAPIQAVAAGGNLFGRTHADLIEWCAAGDLPAYRAGQLFAAMYAQHVRDIAAVSTLPRALRERLSADWVIQAFKPTRANVSTDGTKKYLFATAHPERTVEAAYIPEDDRATLCLSTQVGCKMGCRFCMTARQGFAGQLSVAEILSQYAEFPERDSVTNLVYMGMGEPLDNLDAVLRSIAIFSAADGYAIAQKRITVSTIGVIPAMQEFITTTDCRLAISLHSPFDAERAELMPMQTVYPIERVVAAVKDMGRVRTGRVSFEYIVFAGINHSDAHVKALARLLNGLTAHINLIAFHPIPGVEYQPATVAAMEAFRDKLRAKGIPTTIRRSRGIDIRAACGLLATERYDRSRRQPDLSTAAP